MNNPDKATVVAKVKKAYAPQFRTLFGKDAFADTERAYRYITEAIAAFERTPQFAPFSSKYDRHLAGKAELTKSEARGLAIFEDPARGNCASCHAPPLFTNFTYANLGIPKFADNLFYTLPKELNPDGEAFVDHGLAKTTGDPADEGKFRVPSLRNAARTGPYGHNGYAHRLDEFITAYELPRAPQVLSKQDVADVVAFLRALTDDE
jgi:cytochrome c peroxidase